MSIKVNSTQNSNITLGLLAITMTLLTACGGGGGGGSIGVGSSTGVNAPVVPDTTAPTLAALAAISPLNGTMTAAYATTTTFTANKSLSVASIKMTCDGVDSPGTTSVAGAVVTFTPAAPGYAASAKCTATVNAAGTKDLAGNAFASNVAITNFTVKALNCTGTSSNNPPSFNGTSLVAVCGNVFVEPIVAKNQFPVIVEAVSFAVQSNKNFYGTLTSNQADLIVCSTQACGAYFAGPSLRNVTLLQNTFAGQYTAPRRTVVLTSAATNRNPNILAHEFSHVETDARLNNAFIPAWFNEGLATYIGGEPVCTNVTGKGIASLLSLNLQLDWNVYTGTPETFEKTYCQARAEVAAWISKRGNGAVITLIQAVSQGQSFTSQYGPMQTQ